MFINFIFYKDKVLYFLSAFIIERNDDAATIKS